MSNTKNLHTPGPWQVLPEEVDRPYIRVRGTELGGRYKVANVPTPAYDGVDAREARETRANARLIAAAPELLEALREIADDYADRFDLTCPSTNPGIKSTIAQARAAIAKAA